MTFRIPRRQFLLGSSALAVSSFGLMPTFAQQASLRLAFWGGQDRANRTYAVADMFTAETGTEIAGEFIGWDEYWTRLATQVSGGGAPDVFQMDYRYIVEYASRGVVAPLDDLLGETLRLDGFDEDQVEGGRVGGKLYGVSLGSNSAAMIYNAAVFEEVGIAPPDLSTTYDDYRAMGEAFAKANVRNGIKVLSDSSGSDVVFENWLRQQGSALYTAEGTIGYDEAALLEWFRLWAGLRDAGIIVAPEDQALSTASAEASMIITNKAATTPIHSNELVVYQGLSQEKLGLACYPLIDTGTGGHYRKPSQFFSISGSSANVAEAAAFISFFVNDPGAAKVLGVERGVPCSQRARDALTDDLPPESRAAVEFVGSLGELVGPLPPSPPPAAGEVSKALGHISQEIAFGMRSPEDAAQAFIVDATAILARVG
ncbi:ABC transporter substrate-binding protein [Devosia naphthalenivorans]|uniref:ABC transporter substrate-binding protein n=1 Tax=Devosia naphthalenivorans TaxID=2082392 RepID=UPI000D371E91|nr:extracellular solute-binding protein [Devosia naphthalenivorans]